MTKTLVENFHKDWENSLKVKMIKNRLNKLVKDGIVEGMEIDNLLDNLNIIKRRLLKFYNLKEEML